jgi:hypothetical protein
VKNDLTLLQENRKLASENLRTTMTDLKEDLETYRIAQQDLEKLSKSNNVVLKKESIIILKNAKNDLDGIRLHMNNLNAYSKEWVEYTRSLNILIKETKEEGMPVAEVAARIKEFRAFKSLADPKLEKIRSDLAAYKPKHQKVKEILVKHKKNKSR